MHYMDMNKTYGRLDGIRGPRSCLSRPTSATTWNQTLGCLTVIYRVPCARVVSGVAKQGGGDSSIIDPFSSSDSREIFLGF